MKVVKMEKIRLKHRLGIIIFCFSLASIFIFKMATVTVYADSSKVPVELHVTDNGDPLSNRAYEAYNLDEAYQKIVDGDIRPSDTLSASWKNLQREAQADPNKIEGNLVQFSNGLAIGPGIKHSSEDATVTISYILRMGGLPLLLELNDRDKSDNDKTVRSIFHQSGGKASNYFTDKQGKAVADVSLGLNAIMNRGGAFQKLVSVKDKNQVINLDVANTDARLSISLLADSRMKRTDFNKYVIESGQNNPITFKLKISKDFNRLGGVLTLSSTPNLVVTSVEVPSNIEGMSVQEIHEEGELQNSNPDRQITLPSLTKDITLTIRAYVTPTSTQDAPAEGSLLYLKAVDDNGVEDNIKSPAVVLTGINFVMVDNKTNKLVTGEQYVLGKKTKSSYEIYSEQTGWVTFQSLSNIDLAQVTVLHGGQQYSIGGPSAPILNATNRFNFNATLNKKINQSLIQIIGLNSGDNYFLYPVKQLKDQSLSNKTIDFSVFAKFKIGKNGAVIPENSLGTSKNQNFSLNSTIPDFRTGTMEYNTLSVEGKNPEVINVFKAIILPIALIVLLIFLVGIFLMWLV
ncbi:MAG: hypothetical protein L0I64_09770 [Lactococcus lactis]|nr:hypothetical protein [Lactococcus lactis]MDN6095727.1 hypothetical protein [Lactococcus lactis]